MVLPSFLLVDVVLLTMDVPLFVISLSYLTVVISHTQLPSFNVLDPLSQSRSNIPPWLAAATSTVQSTERKEGLDQNSLPRREWPTAIRTWWSTSPVARGKFHPGAPTLSGSGGS